MAWLVKDFQSESGYGFDLIILTLTLISGSGCGRGLYANVDQSPLGVVTCAFDQSKQL